MGEFKGGKENDDEMILFSWAVDGGMPHRTRARGPDRPAGGPRQPGVRPAGGEPESCPVCCLYPLQVGPPYQLDCLAGLSICDLTFHGAAVPASAGTQTMSLCSATVTAVLGGEGGGLQVVRAVQHGVPHLQTAALLASLKSLLELTAAHCRFYCESWSVPPF